MTCSKPTECIGKIMNSKTKYSESELDCSFAINSVSDFDSASESDSEYESDFNSMFVNLDICIFFILYLHSAK